MLQLRLGHESQTAFRLDLNAVAAVPYLLDTEATL
jgi:hypothetical protein